MSLYPVLELIADIPCETGENPLWHPIEKCLYWTDIEAGRLYRYLPSEQRHQIALDLSAAQRMIGGFTIEADGAILLFMDRGTIARFKNGSIHTLIHHLPAERDSRFNDVIADPEGRVFCGTMPTANRLGTLYRLDRNLTLTPVVTNVTCSNGMAFSPDLKRFYFTDSDIKRISIFDYNRATGSLSNQRPFVQLNLGEALPDGATIDSQGNLWSALWDGASIVRFATDSNPADQNATIAQRIPLPVPKVSSLTFGGSDLQDIYITTAGGNNRATEGALAGSLFRLRSPIPGRPEFLSRIGCK